MNILCRPENSPDWQHGGHSIYPDDKARPGEKVRYQREALVASVRSCWGEMLLQTGLTETNGEDRVPK